MDIKRFFKGLWYFLWHDNSLASWLVNILLAFLIVKFLIYPGLAFLLGSEYPVVAVISSSMEHNSEFDRWWAVNGGYYESVGISKTDFFEFDFANGFNKGDVIVVGKPKNIKIGEVIVYTSRLHPYPIIHRVVGIDGALYKTKGDNNAINDPYSVLESQIKGKALLRIPYLGWVKLVFVKLLGGGFG